jgi:hypothetical protein
MDWRTAFGTSDPAAVEAYCVAHAIAYEWCGDGHLRTTQRRSAIIRHPRTGDEVWFNHVAFWNEWSLDEEVRDVLVDEFGRENLPYNTSFGDGQPLTAQTVVILNDAYEQATLRRPWVSGDLMIVDNILAAHGREAFSGARTILVAMGDPVELAHCQPTVTPSAGFSG